MAKLPPKPKKQRGASKEELLKLDKDELAERIIQLEAHNTQLRNIISKNVSDDADLEKQGQNRKFDFSKCHFRRVLLHILYFGWDYQGLAVQEDSNQTIEHHLFNALTKSCLIEGRETSNYHRCGRTDKGVSAFGQVISINLRSKFPLDQQYITENIEKDMPYCKILNRLLPKEIKAVAWMPIPVDKPDFSARFDCKKRQYKYYFPRSNMDLSAMEEACTHLIGSHDFRHLCKMDVGNGVTEFRREIFRAEIVDVEKWDFESETSMHYLLIEGNAFLWHQIRCIMGVLLLVGMRKESPDIVKDLLDVEKNPRKPQYNMASHISLNLFRCSYELEETNRWIYDRDELKLVITNLQSEWSLHSIKSIMIKDCLKSLEEKYDSLFLKESESGSDRNTFVSYVDSLLQGTKTRIYKPLLKRVTCSSLEEKIEYHKKKRKIADSDDKTKKTTDDSSK